MRGGTGRARLALLLLLTALLGCRTAPALPDETLRQLSATAGAHLTGEVRGADELAVLNAEDFVYSVAWSPASGSVASTRLGARHFALSLFALPTPARGEAFKRRDGRIAPDVDVKVSEQAFDTEALDFSPDGQRLVTASRDSVVRLFDARTGALERTTQLEAPLSAVRFHPSGRYVAVGNTRGEIALLEVPSLRYSGEALVHADEVRALAFSRDGRLFSGGWDRALAIFDTREAPAQTASAQVRFETRGAHRSIRGTLDDAVALSFALDGREPMIVVRAAVALAAGIDVAALTETSPVPTAMGETLARIARGRTLRFKGLELGGVDVAVCEACVPPGSDGVLGAAFLERMKVTFDPASGVALLSRKGPALAPASNTLVLTPRARHDFPWRLNDFTLDARGERVGVAFSEVKAERTREIYQREKQGLVEPEAEGNAAAIVDARTGAILRKWTSHRGVVATAAISPDGKTLASGGWDKRLLLFGDGPAPVHAREFGWSVRRVRFSPDGRFVAVAAWTPQNPVGDHQSDPALTLLTLDWAGTPAVEVAQ